VRRSIVSFIAFHLRRENKPVSGLSKNKTLFLKSPLSAFIQEMCYNV